MSKSLTAYLLCIALLLAGGLCYYPKWKLDRTEATISWDVSGYYFYLPAFLIYDDVKTLGWQDAIIERYYPGPPDQAFQHRAGNMVMKYSLGLALQFLPFFLIADLIAPLAGFPADGFSRPYQLAISLGSLLVACLGLWFLRLALLKFFGDKTVAVVLIIIVFATNYLDYASINHAMTHNYLFTWYAALILLSIRYWMKPSLKLAISIGLVAGLMALTRPTEAIAVLLPLLWSVGGVRDLRVRMRFFREHLMHLVLAIVAFACMGVIQIAYWKYVTGDWIVYSYQDQSFSWLNPHILNGLFSYRAGWLIYTPVMIFSLIGFYVLWKKDKSLCVPIGLLSVLFMYITWAWDIWWYGGSLGQRSMVQLYPVLAFPLAAFVQQINASRYLKMTGALILALCIYYNLWLTHQAHRGGLLRAGEMTGAYFWQILGRYEVSDDAQFRLDSEEWYDQAGNGKDIFYADFEEQESSVTCAIPAIAGNHSLCVSPAREFSPMMKFDVPKDTRWIRATATFRCANKEWDTWKMAQFRVHLFDVDKMVKTNIIRVYRAMSDNDTQQFYIDMEIPDDLQFDQAGVDLWNAGSDKSLAMDNLTVTAF